MISIPSLLATPLPWELAVRAMPDTPSNVSSVALIEDLDHSDVLTPGSLLVLTRATVEAAGGYKLDVFVRHAAQREVAALVLRRSTTRSLTAEVLATRAGVALLDVDDAVDPAMVVDELATMVAGNVRAALRRLAGAASKSWTDTDQSTEDVVAAVASACGVQLIYQPGQSTGGPAVSSNGVRLGVVHSLEAGDPAVIAARLAADVASDMISDREQRVLAPVRTTSTALAQLLLCSQANLSMVASRAADVGLNVSGWHCVARVAVESGSGPTEESIDAGLEAELITLVAKLASRNDSGRWSVARPDDTLVVVRTFRQDPGAEAAARLRTSLHDLISLLHDSHPDLRIQVGIATAHEGPTGLRASAEESRAALAAAQLSDELISFASFDNLGARRMLAEWMTTDVARATVRDVLAPLDALGEERAATAVETLHAYLDEQGSLQRAARRLHVHRNAVVYRLDRIRSAGVDLTDPDDRFALQMACRARLFAATPSDTR